MRPTRRNPPRRGSGVTLLEMVVVMVLTAIVVGSVLFLAQPIQQAADVTVRAQLTDTADNALQRISRDVRLAIPNTVRVQVVGGVSYLEFVPIRAGGRYRNAATGATCASANDLAFDSADTCFSALGTIPNAGEVVGSNDFLVLNNYGRGFNGQNVYDDLTTYSGRLNYKSVTSVTGTTVVLGSHTFERRLHDSPGRRFFIAAPPVSYRCDPTTGKLTRHTGYGLYSAQPHSGAAPGTTIFASGAELASGVTACAFDYTEGVAAHIGLLTLRMTLSKAVTTGTEVVSLYNAVHINNVP